MLRKHPGATAVAVLALALGVGANATIFTAVNAVLLRPLGYRDADRLALIWEQNSKRGWSQSPTSFPNFVDIRRSTTAFEDVCAFVDSGFNLTGSDVPERVEGIRLSANAFELLGVTPLMGRAFLPREGETDAGRVVVLSYGLWHRRFGSSPDLVGRTVSLDGEPYEVVGIMPRGFHFPPPFTATISSSRFTFPNADLWVPLTTDAVPMTRDVRGLILIGRLKVGVTERSAQSELDRIAAQLGQEYRANADMGLSLNPLRQQVTGEVRRPLLILLAAVGFVLLIACANVTNLMLATAAGRQKGIAVRAALGASRFRLLRQSLVESVVLGLLGGCAGILLSYLGIRLLVAFSPPDLPFMKEVGMDPKVFAFTVLVSLLASIIFGLPPALLNSNPVLTEALKEGGRSTAGPSRSLLSRLLIISEVSLALVLLIAAGLMAKSFLRLQSVNTGLDAEGVVTLELQLPQKSYPEAGRRAAFQQQLLRQVAAIPGVRDAGAVDNLPFNGNENNSSFTIKDRPASSQSGIPRAVYRVVSPDYFRVMGIPLLEGRPFSEADAEGALPVCAVNEAAARRFWPGEDPLGSQLKKGRPESKNPWVTVVGVTGSISHTTPGALPEPEIYLPYLQNAGQSLTLVARTETDVGGLAAALRREVSAADKNLPSARVRLMRDVLSDSVAQPRLYALLLGIFGGMALTLAAIGIYGVVSYHVSQRTREIGIRMALGARQSDIFKLVLGRSMLPISAGLVVGLALTFALTRVMSSMLYEVSATDPATLAGIIILMAFVALLACYLPSRRAVKVDPLVALRRE